MRIGTVSKTTPSLFALPFRKALIACLVVSQSRLTTKALVTGSARSIQTTMRPRLIRQCTVKNEFASVDFALDALPREKIVKEDDVAIKVPIEKPKRVKAEAKEQIEVKAEIMSKITTDRTLAMSSNQLLVELGNLTSMVVVSRPSQSIKTPYVADLIMKTNEYCRAKTIKSSNGAISIVTTGPVKKATKKDQMNVKVALSNFLRSTVDPGNVHLGHTPALDCAGMIVPGAVVYCTPNDAHTKTKFTVQLCEEQREDGGVVTVACHPNLAERAARVLLEESLLTAELGEYNTNEVLRQQTFGNSRVDFVVQSLNNDSITLVEVKNVVGADYIEGAVPEGRCEVGVYTMPLKQPDGSDYIRHAIFPHGSKKAEVGVVSDRAIKHVHELTCLHGTVDTQGRKVKSAILFVINRSDCVAFRPCHEADMLFAQMLLRAYERGVILMAKEVIWSGGQGRSGQSLPVAFHPSVCAQDIDEDHLRRVLLFNENGSGRSPSPSKKKMLEDADTLETDDDNSKKKKVKLESISVELEPKGKSEKSTKTS